MAGSENCEININLKTNPPHISLHSSSDMLNEIRSLRAEISQLRLENELIKKMLKNQDTKLVSLEQSTQQILKMKTLPIKEAIVGSWRMISSSDLESFFENCYVFNSPEELSSDMRFVIIEDSLLAFFIRPGGREELKNMEKIQTETDLHSDFCYIKNNHLITAVDPKFEVRHDRYIKLGQLYIYSEYESYTCERVYERIC